MILRVFTSLILGFFLVQPFQTPAWAQSDRPGWSTTTENGIHWLVTPEGRRFYSKGVNIVCGWKRTPKSDLGQAYYWGNHHDQQDEWRQSASERLAQWGFNTLGGWSDDSPLLGLPLTVDLELGRTPEYHWFDPFAPHMQEKVLAYAEKLTAPFRDHPNFMGYFTDNEVGWWNSALFKWYLKAQPENHTKQALLNLIVERYDGKWDLLLKDWVPGEDIKGFEDLRKPGAAMKLRPGGEGIRLVNAFMALCAGHYYETMAGALRRVHPEALIMGDRLPLYYHQDAILAMGSHVDVISTNYNVDVPDGWVAPYFFEGLQRLTDKPVLITEYFFAANENRSGNRNETARNEHPKPGHLMTVETQAQRAWGALNATLNFARFPNVVGAHWFQYADEPFGGREDGEDYNMGLVDIHDRPYEKLIEGFKNINPYLDHLHAAPPPVLTAAADRPTLQRATHETASSDETIFLMHHEGPIHVADRSLIDWNKKETRLLGFQTQAPYVPFGDVHLTWRPEGFYLAAIANTYVDPGFMAYDGEFPLRETFHISFQLQHGGKGETFTVYLSPSPDPSQPDGFSIRPVFTRQVEGGEVEVLPTEGYVQKLEKSLPHIQVELFIPARWLGIPQLEEGTRWKMNLNMTSFYREFYMVWAGNPAEPLQDGEIPREWREVELKRGAGDGRWVLTSDRDAT